jgi:AMP-polyphosphate phosphotransferase
MDDGQAFEPMEPDMFAARVERLREELLDAQFDLADSAAGTILILLNGPDGSGKGEVLNRLHEWLDPRAIKTMAYDIDAAEGNRRPGGWQYWRDMPRYGRVGVVLGSWYHVLLLRRATQEIDRGQFVDRLEMVNRVEAMLSDERVQVVKIWLGLSADKAAKRFRRKHDGPGGFKHPLVREWSRIDKKKERERLVEAAEDVIAATGPGSAPWYYVPATDPLARDIAVGELVLKALREALARRSRHAPRTPSARPRRISSGPSALKDLDLSLTVDKTEYQDRLTVAQKRLYEQTRSKAFKNRGLVCVFEGNDAAGKGGAIKRLRGALDPVRSEVYSIAAPDEAARAHPYLWRFWLKIPGRGETAIFDRSWYGRVLVERVEGFAAPADWRRAYDEINDFEHLLAGGGYIVQKFWLSIDQDEQLARFEARKEVPHKRFKITDEDWRNREKWPLYAAAVEDMIALTSTPLAPWTLVEANDKRHARVKVIETLVNRLEAEL